MDRTFCCIAENREGEEDEGESSSREEGLLKYGRGIVEEIRLWCLLDGLEDGTSINRA